MKVLLDACFRQKKSNSIVIIGDEGSGKEQFVMEVVNSYRPEASEPSSSSSPSSSLSKSSLSKSSAAEARVDTEVEVGVGEKVGPSTTANPRFRVARIRGRVDGSDQLALVSLARQLFFQRPTERKFDANLESVEMALRTSYSQGTPTIIIIEDVHEFVLRKKQLLLYTLLDLMHRNDLLFALIGITHKADFNLSLEKRVVSRLNAQYVHLSSASAERISTDLNARLTLPPSFGLDVDGDDGEGDAEGPDPVTVAAFTSFRRSFNAQVNVVFPIVAVDAAPGTVYPGSAIRLIRGHVNHGCGINYFIRAALMAVLHLTCDEPFVKPLHIRKALLSLNPPCPSQTLAGCPSVEVYLLGTLVRLLSKVQVGAAFCSTAVTGSGASRDSFRSLPSSSSSSSSTADAMQIALAEGMGRDGSLPFSRVLHEFDKMTGLLRKDILPRGRLVQAAQALASMGFIDVRSELRASSRSVSVGKTVFAGEYRLRLLTDLDEVRTAFRASVPDAVGVQTPGEALKIPDYMRKAILNPLEPIVQPGSGLGLV